MPRFTLDPQDKEKANYFVKELTTKYSDAIIKQKIQDSDSLDLQALKYLYNSANFFDTSIQKTIFKGLVLLSHPDKNPNNQNATDFFKIVQGFRNEPGEPEWLQYISRQLNQYIGSKQKEAFPNTSRADLRGANLPNFWRADLTAAKVAAERQAAKVAAEKQAAINYYGLIDNSIKYMEILLDSYRNKSWIDSYYNSIQAEANRAKKYLQMIPASFQNIEFSRKEKRIKDLLHEANKVSLEISQQQAAARKAREAKLAAEQAAARKAREAKLAAEQAAARKAQEAKLAAEQAAARKAREAKLAAEQAAARKAQEAKLAAEQAAARKAKIHYQTVDNKISLMKEYLSKLQKETSVTLMELDYEFLVEHGKAAESSLKSSLKSIPQELLNRFYPEFFKRKQVVKELLEEGANLKQALKDKITKEIKDREAKLAAEQAAANKVKIYYQTLDHEISQIRDCLSILQKETSITLIDLYYEFLVKHGKAAESSLESIPQELLNRLDPELVKRKQTVKELLEEGANLKQALKDEIAQQYNFPGYFKFKESVESKTRTDGDKVKSSGVAAQQPMAAKSSIEQAAANSSTEAKLVAGQILMNYQFLDKTISLMQQDLLILKQATNKFDIDLYYGWLVSDSLNAQSHLKSISTLLSNSSDPEFLKREKSIKDLLEQGAKIKADQNSIEQAAANKSREAKLAADQASKNYRSLDKTISLMQQDLLCLKQTTDIFKINLYYNLLVSGSRDAQYYLNSISKLLPKLPNGSDAEFLKREKSIKDLLEQGAKIKADQNAIAQAAAKKSREAKLAADQASINYKYLDEKISLMRRDLFNLQMATNKYNFDNSYKLFLMNAESAKLYLKSVSDVYKNISKPAEWFQKEQTIKEILEQGLKLKKVFEEKAPKPETTQAAVNHHALDGSSNHVGGQQQYGNTYFSTSPYKPFLRQQVPPTKDEQLLTSAEIKLAQEYFKENPMAVKFSRKNTFRSKQLPYSVIKSSDGKLYVLYRGNSLGSKNGVLGKGSYGKVKLAKSLFDGTVVAAKMELLNGQLDRARVAKEIAMQAAAQQYLGSNERKRYTFTGQIQYKNYIFSKFFEGQTLWKSILSSGTSLQKLEMLLMSLKALQKIHDKGIIHCDLNFNNILFDPITKQAQVIDFGFAEKANANNFAQFTKGPLPFNPNRYYAPELSRSNPVAYFSSDLYSFGRGIQLAKLSISGLPNLVARMTSMDPSRRPKIQDCINEIETLIAAHNNKYNPGSKYY